MTTLHRLFKIEIQRGGTGKEPLAFALISKLQTLFSSIQLRKINDYTANLSRIVYILTHLGSFSSPHLTQT